MCVRLGRCRRNPLMIQPLLCCINTAGLLCFVRPLGNGEQARSYHVVLLSTTAEGTASSRTRAPPSRSSSSQSSSSSHHHWHHWSTPHHPIGRSALLRPPGPPGQRAFPPRRPAPPARLSPLRGASTCCRRRPGCGGVRMTGEGESRASRPRGMYVGLGRVRATLSFLITETTARYPPHV